MKNLRLPIFAALMAFALSNVAMAYDFSRADRLFAARENSPANIAQARTLYAAALGQVQGQELIYAVERLAKLAYYEGDLLTSPDDKDKRAGIFTQCQEYVDHINPNNIHSETAVYYYWKTACLALWGESVSQWTAMFHVNELKGLLADGLRVDPNYEGGGMHRLAAAIYVRSTNMRLVGLYDPAAALTHINAAIAVGPEYFNAFLLKGMILKALDRNDDALAVLTTAKRQLEQKLATNSVQEDLLPESKVFLRQMNDLMSRL